LQSSGGFRKLQASVRMSDGMPETENASIAEPTQAPPQISERDQQKLERRRRKEERQRLVRLSDVVLANQLDFTKLSSTNNSLWVSVASALT
jgi:hypothetical protein